MHHQTSQTNVTRSAYSGNQELEAMKLAENYNSFIVNLVIEASRDNLDVVDFGAGNGLFAEKLKSRGYSVQCVEIDDNLAEEIATKGLSVEKSIQNIPIQKFIYSLNVLEHIEDDLETLQKIYAHLEPNGKVFIYVPAFQILYSANDRRVGHFRRYRKNDLCVKLKQVGFEIEEARYVDTVGFFCTLLYKLIGSNSGELNKRSLVFFDRFLFPLNRFLDPVFRNMFGKNAYVIGTKK